MSNNKKRHHFVSRFYLEGFVDQYCPPYLWLFDKQNKTIAKASSVDAGCRTSFYAFPKNDGTVDTNSLEDIFGKLESQVAPLLEKIESREELTNEERSAVSYFISLTLTKVPNFRSNIELQGAQFIKEIGMLLARKNGFDDIKDKLAREGKPIDEELHVRMVQKMTDVELDVEVAPHASIEQFLRRSIDLAPIIHQMYWIFLHARGRYRLVTSDNPVTYADPTHNPTSRIGVGLKTPNVEVTFPITQKLALLAGWKDWG